jgi:hypothetical protein
MRGDHCGRHIGVAQQFLYRAYVAPGLKQVRHETGSQRVQGGRLGDAGIAHSPLEGPVLEMVPADGYEQLFNAYDLAHSGIRSAGYMGDSAGVSFIYNQTLELLPQRSFLVFFRGKMWSWRENCMCILEID